MIALLFAVGWWLALALAVFGALLFGALIAAMVAEWLRPVSRVPRAQRVPPRPVVPAVPLRPFDQCDPLEQAFALPCAPDPRRMA